MPARANVLIGTLLGNAQLMDLADVCSFHYHSPGRPLCRFDNCFQRSRCVVRSVDDLLLYAGHRCISLYGSTTDRSWMVPHGFRTNWIHRQHHRSRLHIHIQHNLLPSIFAPPVTPATMNYTSLVSYGLVLFVLIWWFARGRKIYKGPKLSSETL